MHLCIGRLDVLVGEDEGGERAVRGIGDESIDPVCCTQKGGRSVQLLTSSEPAAAERQLSPAVESGCQRTGQKLVGALEHVGEVHSVVTVETVLVELHIHASGAEDIDPVLCKPGGTRSEPVRRIRAGRGSAGHACWEGSREVLDLAFCSKTFDRGSWSPIVTFWASLIVIAARYRQVSPRSQLAEPGCGVDCDGRSYHRFSSLSRVNWG